MQLCITQKSVATGAHAGIYWHVVSPDTFVYALNVEISASTLSWKSSIFAFLVSNLYWMNTFERMYNSEICRNWSSCRSRLTCSYPGDLRICSQRWAIGLDMILKLGKTSFCVSNCRHTSAREWCSLIITSWIYILNPFNKCLSNSLIVRGIEQMALSLEDWNVLIYLLALFSINLYL